MMERELFSKAEAERLVGTCVRTLVEFSGVPKGTCGTVIRADLSVTRGPAAPIDEVSEEYSLAVQWDLPVGPQVIEAGAIEGERFLSIRGGKPLVDWFTKSEYERYLAETT